MLFKVRSHVQRETVRCGCRCPNGKWHKCAVWAAAIYLAFPFSTFSPRLFLCVARRVRLFIASALQCTRCVCVCVLLSSVYLHTGVVFASLISPALFAFAPHRISLRFRLRTVARLRKPVPNRRIIMLRRVLFSGNKRQKNMLNVQMYTH